MLSRQSSAAALLTLFALTGCAGAVADETEATTSAEGDAIKLTDVLVSSFAASMDATVDASRSSATPTCSGNSLTAEGTSNGMTALGLVAFDLKTLQKNSVILSAELELSFTSDSLRAAGAEVMGCWGGWDCNNPSFFPMLPFMEHQEIGAVTRGPTGDVFDVTNIVAGWVGGTRPNNGFVVSSSSGVLRYQSSETSAGAGPRLTVTYRALP